MGQHAGEPPPPFGTWPGWYATVIGAWAAQIVAYTLLTRWWS